MACYLLVAVCFALPATSAPAAADLEKQLDETLSKLKSYEYGRDSGPLQLVETIVAEAAVNPAQRKIVEQRLLNTLRSDATIPAKSFLCRQIRIIGTVRSVPVLETLLTDPDLSHMARYVLGSMAEPAALAALHRGLKKTTGKIQIGLINTLADRRYLPTLPDIIPLLPSPNSALAHAAARALGRLGTVPAAQALIQVRTSAPRELRQTVENALLHCAEQLLQSKQIRPAENIYREFYTAGPTPHFRIAGLRGLLLIPGGRPGPLLMEALRSDDPALQRSAIGFLPLVKNPRVTLLFADNLPSLPPEIRELVIRALGDRGDPVAAPALARAAQSPEQSVRQAALEALGRVGGVAEVPLLAQKAAEASGDEQKIARAALTQMKGPGVDMALIRTIGSGPAPVRIEAIRVLADRRVNPAVLHLLKTARDNNPSVRIESIRALGALAGESHLDEILQLFLKTPHADDRSALESALAALLKRIEDNEKQATPLLAALSAAPLQAKPALIRLLVIPATPSAQRAVEMALRDPSTDIKDAAVRTLSQWPHPAPAETLLSLAQSAADRTHKVLALRGYVRLAGLTENPTAMYARALDLARRPDDKKLVLAGLGSASSASALALVEKYLADNTLRAEAAAAAVQIADRLRSSDPARAKTSLKNIIALLPGSPTARRAQEIINDLEKYEGYITRWRAAGPYQLKGKESRAVFDTPFPPEKFPQDGVKWSRLTKGLDNWQINLESTFGGLNHCAAYLAVRLWSPESQKARLELGSDDAVKAWLNQKPVHANYTHRSAAPRQDLVEITLQKGWNDLLLKVVDHEGGWAFCCRLRRPDGAALDNLKIE